MGFIDFSYAEVAATTQQQEAKRETLQRGPRTLSRLVYGVRIAGFAANRFTTGRYLSRPRHHTPTHGHEHSMQHLEVLPYHRALQYPA